MRSPDVPQGTPLRVMHFNVLADCLAKSAPALSSKRGFRCSPKSVQWDHRRELLRTELTRHGCDVVGLCEVDRFEDFEAMLVPQGYGAAFRRKRSPAKDGSALFWRADRMDDGLSRAVFLERGARRIKGAQVALLQRLVVQPGPGPGGAPAGPPRSVVVCITHLKASADDTFRMQQAAEAGSGMGRALAKQPWAQLCNIP